MDPKNAIIKRTIKRYNGTEKVPELITAPKKTAPTNKTKIEIINPVKTANRFILLFIRFIRFSLTFRFVPHFLQNNASSLLSEPHLVQFNSIPPNYLDSYLINLVI